MGYCTSCGSPIPDGQGSSCSMCYGDPYHGSDGYYMNYLEKQEQEAQRQREAERAEEERIQQEIDDELPF